MAYGDELWTEAKRKCRLSDNHIKIAKELNISPKSLIKNIPNKSEQWKAPVGIWLDSLYEKKQKLALQKQRKKQKIDDS